jgi:pimeloyl-ACP methyl ester carboxylesterase
LRLGRRDPATHPWLRNVVSWSPASSWGSWARSSDAIKPGLAAATRGRMGEAEGDGSVHDFFHGVGGRASQGGHWYSDSWGCTTNALTASHRGVYEIYNSRFRRWHWRVAYEQLIFSHWDSDNPDPGIDPDPERDARSGPARYAQIRSRLLLAAGYDDDAWPEKIFSFTLELAGRMRTRMAHGSAFFVKDTGHSIHAEKPAFFAGRILDFLFESPLPPFPAFLVPAIGS